MATTFKQDYIDLLKHYCYVNGMLEVVQNFANNIDKGSIVIPIEVKAETNLKAKSLKTFCGK